MAAVPTSLYCTTMPSLDHQNTPLQQSSTEEYLCNLSKTLIHFLNNRQYDSPFIFSHVRPNVYTELQGKTTIGLHPFVHNYARDAQGSPTFHVDVDLNVTACADDEAGGATVIMSQHLSGYVGKYRGMGRAGTIQFSWQRRKGRWWCSGATMIYGTPVFLD